MFEFIRGNKDSLEGRASIYVYNFGLPRHGVDIRYPAVHIGQSVLDLIFPGEEVSKEEIERVERKIEGSSYNKSKLEAPIIFTRPIDVKNPEELNSLPGDIIFAGKVPFVDLVADIFPVAGLLYNLRYNDQLSERIKGRKEAEIVVPREDFRQLDENGLVSRLYNLTAQLFSAREQRDGQKEDYVRQQLKQLSHGSRFAPQIGGLVEAFSQLDSNPNVTRMIELQIRLAGCLHAEKYIEAAKLKKELEQLIRQ